MKTKNGLSTQSMQLTSMFTEEMQTTRGGSAQCQPLTTGEKWFLGCFNVSYIAFAGYLLYLLDDVVSEGKRPIAKASYNKLVSNQVTSKKPVSLSASKSECSYINEGVTGVHNNAYVL